MTDAPQVPSCLFQEIATGGRSFSSCCCQPRNHSAFLPLRSQDEQVRLRDSLSFLTVPWWPLLSLHGVVSTNAPIITAAMIPFPRGLSWDRPQDSALCPWKHPTPAWAPGDPFRFLSTLFLRPDCVGLSVHSRWHTVAWGEYISRVGSCLYLIYPVSHHRSTLCSVNVGWLNEEINFRWEGFVLAVVFNVPSHWPRPSS